MNGKTDDKVIIKTSDESERNEITIANIGLDLFSYFSEGLSEVPFLM